MTYDKCPASFGGVTVFANLLCNNITYTICRQLYWPAMVSSLSEMAVVVLIFPLL